MTAENLHPIALLVLIAMVIVLFIADVLGGGDEP